MLLVFPVKAQIQLQTNINKTFLTMGNISANIIELYRVVWLMLVARPAAARVPYRTPKCLEAIGAYEGNELISRLNVRLGWVYLSNFLLIAPHVLHTDPCIHVWNSGHEPGGGAEGGLGGEAESHL